MSLEESDNLLRLPPSNARPVRRRINPQLGLMALLASFGALPRPPKKTKAQIRRESTGTEPAARPVASRRQSDIDVQARRLQLRNEELNRTRPGSKKLCVNLKKLRAELRAAAAAEVESTETLETMAYKAA